MLEYFSYQFIVVSLYNFKPIRSLFRDYYGRKLENDQKSRKFSQILTSTEFVYRYEQKVCYKSCNRRRQFLFDAGSLSESMNDHYTFPARTEVNKKFAPCFIYLL